jgi:hypothetical protein
MIADVHSELYLQILRTPLPELFEQLEMSAEDADCSASQFRTPEGTLDSLAPNPLP